MMKTRVMQLSVMGVGLLSMMLSMMVLAASNPGDNILPGSQLDYHTAASIRGGAPVGIPVTQVPGTTCQDSGVACSYADIPCTTPNIGSGCGGCTGPNNRGCRVPPGGTGNICGQFAVKCCIPANTCTAAGCWGPPLLANTGTRYDCQ